MLDKAVEKIEQELKEFKGDQPGQIIKDAMAETLKEFAHQNEEFAKAIALSDKTLTDCCAAVTKGITTGISDAEAYRRAVAFYFPGATVKFQMVIDLYPEEAKQKSVILDLADFLS